MEKPSEGAAQAQTRHELKFWLAVASAAAGIFVAVASGAYKVGYAEAKVQSIEGLEAGAQCRASLTVTQTASTDLRSRLAEWKAAHEGALAEIERLRAEREGMLARMEKLDSCAFFQEQIVALQSEIDHPFVIRAITAEGETTTQPPQKKAELEKRLADYLQKMAACQQ